MQEAWVSSLGQEDPLEKGMATHSSILAWRIPLTEEPIVHGVSMSQTQLNDVHFHVQFLLSVFGGGGLVAKLCPTLCDPVDCSSQAPLSVGFSRQEYWSGLPGPPPGDLPNSGIKPLSLAFPALVGRFVITSTTWEAQSLLHLTNKD